MKIQFTTVAHKELLEAIEYYNSLREGLGYEFSMEVDDGIQKIEQFTDAWQEISLHIRRFLIKHITRLGVRGLPGKRGQDLTS